jgi:hypothetical protein
MNPNLKAAIKYQQAGYSIIPAKRDKRPYVGWIKYQTEKATEKQIKEWWQIWPNANPAIVTGEISGIMAVDADSEAGQEALNQFLSDTLITPTSKTPKGNHNIFKYRPGLSNGVRIITDCDLKTDGGYIIVPPGENESGHYSWLPGLSIFEAQPADMPDMLFDTLKQGADPTSAPKREHKNKIKSYSGGDNIDVTTNRQHLTTSDNIGFEQGCRDNTLFHLAYHLVKGGMPVETIRKYLDFIAENCSPPFPEKEIQSKIQSALKRTESREKGLTQEIREMILTTSGNISTTFVYNRQQVTTREEKKKVAVILRRLAEEGLLEPTGARAGEYRIVDANCESEDWQNTYTDPIDLWLPFGLGNIVEVMNGDISLVSGAQNAGKTAFLMNVAKENRDNYNVHYFSSEMSAAKFNRRMAMFSDVLSKNMNIKFYSRSSNFVDVIKTGESNLNIIDYIEMHDNFYLISKILAELHDKLDGALLVAAIQKDPNAKYGRGGSFNQEKPVLSLSLDHNVARITKLKEWNETVTENPNNKEYRFKLVNGCQFVKVQDWHYPPPKES